MDKNKPKIKYPEVKVSDVFRIFWQASKPNSSSLVLSLLGVTAGTLVVIATPIYYKKFFDLLIATGDKAQIVPQLIHIILVVLSLNGLLWIGYRVSGFASNQFQTKVIARLKQVAFDSMIGHAYSFFANNFTGALVQRVNRFANAFERLADRLTFDILSIFIRIVGITAVVWTIKPVFAGLILTWVGFFLLFNYFFAIWKLKYDVKRAASDSATTAVLSDAITNHNTIQLFNGHDQEQRNLEQATVQQADISKFTWDLDVIATAVQSAFLILMEFTLFYIAIPYWVAGLITAGTFVLLQVYVIDLGDKIFSFSRIVRDMYQSYADAKEMVQIMKLPKEIQDAPNATPLQVRTGEIVFDDVEFGFSGNKTVLNKITVTIKAGEKIALVGPSGAGKSTFVKLLLRFYDTKFGSILIDGQEINQVTKASLYDAISLVPQDPVLFHRTLRENIAYGKKDATEAEIIQAAQLAHCDEFIREFPQGYDTYVGERGIKLSGGERQRVAIARAILKNAPILVLDEATSSLDSHSESLIQEALANLMQGKTTIVIAHRLSTVRQMDRILVIDNGVIVEDGSHEKLTRQRQGLYKKLWQLQAGGFLGE